MQRGIRGPLDLDGLDAIFGLGLRFVLTRRSVPDPGPCRTAILSRAADLLRLETFIDLEALPSYVLTAMNEISPPQRSSTSDPCQWLSGVSKTYLLS